MTKAILMTLLLALENGQAAERWIRVASPNFEVYTTGGKGAASDALDRFEQMRSLFLSKSGGLASPPLPVRIFMFSDPKHFLQYGSLNTAGFYQPNAERDFIVLNGASSGALRAVIPAFVYALLQHSGYRYPNWIKSGVAEYYASVQFSGLQATLGAPVPGYVAYLRNNQVMDLELFFARQDALYVSSDRTERERFSAQSWGLVHMLSVGLLYRQQAGEFLRLVSSGMPAAEALRKTYDKTLDQVKRDLQTHIALPNYLGVRWTIEPPERRDKGSIESLSAMDSETALGELLGSLPAKQEEARARYVMLASQYPKDGRPHAGLARLAARANRADEARREFQRAFELGYESAASHYAYAGLNAANPEVNREHLQRAVSLNPNHLQAWRALAENARRRREHDLAIQYLTAAQKLRPDDVDTWVLVSRVYAEGGHPDEARSAERRARQSASTAAEIRVVDQLKQSLDKQLAGK